MTFCCWTNDSIYNQGIFIQVVQFWANCDYLYPYALFITKLSQNLSMILPLLNRPW